MTARRYVASYTYPEGCVVQTPTGPQARGRAGFPREFAIVIVMGPERTGKGDRADRAKAALRWAKALGIARGAVRITVAPETASHNIPALDPVGWRAREEYLAELTRRMREPVGQP